MPCRVNHCLHNTLRHPPTHTLTLTPQIKFRYLVVDEGHRLKNFNCRLIRELKTIPNENRLLLTGGSEQQRPIELPAGNGV